MKPFTYLIGWSDVDKYYYGVKYADGCSAKDLWKSYFTSSDRVATMRESHGDPDIVQVRKEFKTKSQAIEWEHRVLRRMKVCSREDFLNQSSGKASGNYQRLPHHRERLAELGRENKNLVPYQFKKGHKSIRYADTSFKQSESRKKFLKENPPVGEKNSFFGKKHTEEFKVAQRKLKGKRVFCEDTWYDSIKFAASEMRVSRNCINYRLKTREDYYYGI